MSLLSVADLTVSFAQDGRRIEAVRGVSFHVDRGETVALVGESGSGKSVTALSTVGLDPDVAMPKRRHEFSGGQCQRICIARALVLEPKVLICDEPVSALDVSVQAQILNLLEDMKAEYGLTLVFISHDLAVVHYISNRILVMQQGKIVEQGSADQVYQQPAHEYTRKLLDAIPGKSLRLPSSS